MKVTLDLPDDKVRDLDKLVKQTLTGSRGRCIEYIMIENSRLKTEITNLTNIALKYGWTK